MTRAWFKQRRVRSVSGVVMFANSEHGLEIAKPLVDFGAAERRGAMNRLNLLGSPFSPVRFGAQFSRNSGTIREFQERCNDILCRRDWVAERSGFEPLVQPWSTLSTVLCRMTFRANTRLTD